MNAEDISCQHTAFSPDAHATASATATTTAVRPKLLIVEDDARSASALATLFRHLGFETACAGNLAEATRLLQWNPGFVLLDLMLPDGNGKQILEQIRQSHLPIRVAITTGADDSMLLSEVSALRPDAMYRKPLDLEKISRWLGGRAS